MTIMMLTVGGDVVRNHMINTVPRRPPGDAEPEDEAENARANWGRLGACQQPQARVNVAQEFAEGT